MIWVYNIYYVQKSEKVEITAKWIEKLVVFIQLLNLCCTF